MDGHQNRFVALLSVHWQDDYQVTKKEKKKTKSQSVAANSTENVFSETDFISRNNADFEMRCQGR